MLGGDSNFYRYVGNRPTTLVDPSGLISSGEAAGKWGPDIGHDVADDLIRRPVIRINAELWAIIADALGASDAEIKDYIDSLRRQTENGINSAIDAAAAAADSIWKAVSDAAWWVYGETLYLVDTIDPNELIGPSGVGSAAFHRT